MKLNRNNYCNKWGVTGNNCSYYTWNRGGKNENKHMFCAVSHQDWQSVSMMLDGVHSNYSGIVICALFTS